MKIKIRVKELNKNLKIATSILSSSENDGVTGVIFKAEKDKLILMSKGNPEGNPMALLIEIKEQYTCFKEGEIFFPSSTIYNIINNIKESEEVELVTVDENVCRISTKNFTGDLNLGNCDGFDFEQFDIQNKNQWKKYSITKNFISKMNHKIIRFCSDLDVTKKGMLWHANADKGIIECVCTDTHRLGYLSNEFETNDNFRIVLHRVLIRKVYELSEKIDNIEFYLSDKKIIFVFNNIWLSSSLVDSKFPNIQGILSLQNLYNFKINRLNFEAAIKRGLALISTRSDKILRLNINKTKIKISFRSEDVGSSFEEIAIEGYEGPEMNIVFNVQYINDFIQSIESQDLIFSLTNALKPIIIKDEKDPLFIGFVTARRS